MVTGPLNITEAVAAIIPRTLKTETGATATVDWQLRRSLPRGAQPFTYPRGVFDILPGAAVRFPNRSPGGIDASTASATDSDTFVSGTLSYNVVQRDISSVTSVSGTVSGSPHTFVATTDYTFTDDAIVFTGTGVLPDNGTVFARTYTHRLFARRWEAAARYNVRAMLYVKDAIGSAAIGGKEYPKEVLAQVLGESLEQQLRRKSGTQLKVAGTSTEMTRQAMVGPVSSSMMGVPDESESIAIWIVDFRIDRHHHFADAAVERIRTTTVGSDVEFDG
jgi:hypothetical protein